jgi:hypothetical protein
VAGGKWLQRTIFSGLAFTRPPRLKLIRWLRGHSVSGRRYEPLWNPQINLGDDTIYLGFRDLMEARVANAFINAELSPQKVRIA